MLKGPTTDRKLWLLKSSRKRPLRQCFTIHLVLPLADLSLSESLPPPSLISDSLSLTANSLVDKSSASTAFIEKSSLVPSETGVHSISVLQETRPNHSGAQETKSIAFEEFGVKNWEELKEYRRSRGWKVRTWSALILTVGLHN